MDIPDESRHHGANTPSNGINHLRSTSSSLNGREPWPFSWTAAVAQHFLMSAAARTLRWSTCAICQMMQRTRCSARCGGPTPTAPDLPQVQLRRRLYLLVSPGVQMQGLPSAVLGDQRNLARVPEATGSDAADGFQLVRQRRQGHQ